MNPNSYRMPNGSVAQCGFFEIFRHSDPNVSPDWYVSGIESECFYLATEPKCSERFLKWRAVSLLRDRCCVIGEIHFQFREHPLNRRAEVTPAIGATPLSLKELGVKRDH